MSNDELEALRADALENNQAFSKARLRRELRMKPAPGATPIKTVRNKFGTQCPIYRVADCVPMRAAPNRQKEPSEKQKENQREFGRRAYLRSRAGRAGETAKAWLSADALFLDTETTGLGPEDEIVEIAIVDAAGTVLLESLCRPTVPVSEGAYRVHGIGTVDLSGAPAWPELAETVKSLLADRPIVVFNAGFDWPILAQTARAHGDTFEAALKDENRCAMRLAADFFGPTNRYGTISLADAADCAGLAFQGRAHSAAGDAVTTAALVSDIANEHDHRIARGSCQRAP